MNKFIILKYVLFDSEKFSSNSCKTITIKALKKIIFLLKADYTAGPNTIKEGIPKLRLLVARSINLI